MIPGEVRAVEYHTGGEPFRIVTDVPDLAGATVAERRVAAMADPKADGLRALLCSEPRGHADMYGGFVIPPDDDGADLGVLFWHKDGFSTACGHGTIALGVWAIHTGVVAEHPSGTTEVVIDVPSGRVTARVRSQGRRVSDVAFVSVPSYVLHSEVKVETSAGPLTADVAFGGAIYAQVAASDAQLSVTPGHLNELIALGREIKAALADTEYARHPSDDRLGGIYGVIFFEDQGVADNGDLMQRNVTVFADGEVDRSPCGSGTAARLATLTASGVLTDGQHLRHESIVGSVFRAHVAETTAASGVHGVVPSVVPVVSGMAYRTGEHVFVVDPDDPMTPGFVLR